MLKNVKYLITTDSIEKMPKDQIPEIVILGKSNVGKSTFINTITNNKKMARVSSVPGKTRAISLFDIDNKFRLADIPGYGYAKVSKSQYLLFYKMIETYLSKRENIEKAILLIDIRRGIQEADFEMINYLTYYKINIVIIGVKKDKAKQQDILKFKRQIKDLLDTTPLFFSAYSKYGLKEVLEIFS